jgi:hypothetical protein
MTQHELEIRAFLHDIAESGTFIEDYVRAEVRALLASLDEPA